MPDAASTSRADPGGVPTFGTPLPGVRYRERPGVYGIALDSSSLVMVVRTPFGLWLPGGGTDDDAPLDALRRELLEETGYALRSARLLAVADQYVENEDRRVFLLKHCAFYEIEATGPLGPPLEHDHVVEWMPLDAAVAGLAEPASAWALEQARSRSR